MLRHTGILQPNVAHCLRGRDFPPCVFAPPDTDQETFALIRRKGYHDPAEDAAASMELYKLFVEYQDSYTEFELFQARQYLAWCVCVCVCVCARARRCI